MDEILIFNGFTQDQIDEGKKKLSEKGEDLSNIAFVLATEEMLKSKVEKLLNNISEGKIEQKEPEDKDSAKVVIMAVGSQEKAFSVMRAFKSVLKKPAEAAFAMVTENSLEWTLDYYIDHVGKEHEYMKKNDPSKDKDMKRVR